MGHGEGLRAGIHVQRGQVSRGRGKGVGGGRGRGGRGCGGGRVAGVVGVVVVVGGAVAAVHGGGVGGQRVLGGVHAAAQLAREPLRLHRVLVQNVRLEVILVTDHLVAVRTDARRVEQ